MHEFEKLLNEALNIQESAKQVGGLPSPTGVLYQGPNPDGSRKLCKNCFMWCKDNKCLAFAKNQTVKENQVCGYHIYGKPREKWEDMGVMKMDTKLAGLITAPPGGTSCDRCEYFDDNICLGTKGEDGHHPKVDPKGCCGRWDPI